MNKTPQNRTALEYLLAYTLQKRDLKGFMNYYPSDANINHEPIPRSYQEALAYIWGTDSQGFPGHTLETVSASNAGLQRFHADLHITTEWAANTANSVYRHILALSVISKIG